MNKYSSFEHEIADIGSIEPNAAVSAIFKFIPIVENNPKYLFAVPSCGCLSHTWNNDTNTLTVKWSVGSISQFHQNLGITELPQEKSISVFIEELGIQKEHVLFLKLKIKST